MIKTHVQIIDDDLKIPLYDYDSDAKPSNNDNNKTNTNGKNTKHTYL